MPKTKTPKSKANSASKRQRSAVPETSNAGRETASARQTPTSRPQREAAKANAQPRKADMVHDTPRRTRARQSAIRNANDEVKTYWIHGLELTVGQDTEPEATPKHVAGRRLRRETTYFQLPVTQHGEEMNGLVMAASGVNVPQASFGHSSKKGKAKKRKEDVDEDDTKRKRAFSIQDLPAGCRDDDQWSRSFLPSYFAFVAVQRDVWGFSGKRAVDAMQTIWNAIYDGNIPYKIRVSDCPVYSVAQQRLSDSWRGAIGFAALNQVVSMFYFNDYAFPSDEACRSYAQHQLTDQRFLYSKPTEGKGLFFGNDFLQVFAVHFNIVRGMKDLQPVDLLPVGVAGLCAAAVERAYSLWAFGNITIERASQKKTNHYPLTPTEHLWDTSFSDSVWGVTTRDITGAIQATIHEDMPMEVDIAAISDPRAKLKYIPDSDDEGVQ
ncbi:hypothetical protein BGW80DRAFT_1463801 [Lactifluus volemus]|nr:hypothetical protein BGW80DRAFT_1463801 [Lactifluus volemus]